MDCKSSKEINDPIKNINSLDYETLDEYIFKENIEKKINKKSSNSPNIKDIDNDNTIKKP